MTEERITEVLEIIRRYDTEHAIKPWSDYVFEYKRYLLHCQSLGNDPEMTLSELAYIIIGKRNDFIYDLSVHWYEHFAKTGDLMVAARQAMRAIGLDEDVVYGKLSLNHFRDGPLALGNAVLALMGANPIDGDYDAYRRCLSAINLRLLYAKTNGVVGDVVLYMNDVARKHLQQAFVEAGAHNIGVEHETSVLQFPPEPISRPHLREFVFGEFRLKGDDDVVRPYRLRVCYGNI